MTADSGCSPEIRFGKDGRTFWAVQSDDAFTVDVESASLMMDFELDRMLEMHDSGFSLGGITAAYKWYVSYGVLTLAHGQNAGHDEVARRTEFKDRNGLTLDYSVSNLLNMAVSFSDLSPSGRSAWAGKATTASAQRDLWSLAQQEVLELV